MANRITIYSHSSLLYWWPVWLAGFIMAAATWASPVRSVLVDPTATYSDGAWHTAPHGEQMLHVSSSKNVGVLFLVVLLLVIAITNVPMRGVWSVVAIMSIILLSVVAAWLGWWEEILHRLDLLDVRINLGGYLLVSGVLFALWLVVVVFFDRQVYAEVIPGRIDICDHIGGGIQTFGGPGTRLTKKPSDLFRHWIIGFGSGDIEIHTAEGHIFEYLNVMMADRKIREANRLLSMVITDGQRPAAVQARVLNS